MTGVIRHELQGFGPSESGYQLRLSRKITPELEVESTSCMVWIVLNSIFLQESLVNQGAGIRPSENVGKVLYSMPFSAIYYNSRN